MFKQNRLLDSTNLQDRRGKQRYLQALPLRPCPSLSATAGQIVVGGADISPIAAISRFRSDSASHLKGMVKVERVNKCLNNKNEGNRSDEGREQLLRETGWKGMYARIVVRWLCKGEG